MAPTPWAGKRASPNGARGMAHTDRTPASAPELICPKVTPQDAGDHGCSPIRFSPVRTQDAQCPDRRRWACSSRIEAVPLLRRLQRITAEAESVGQGGLALDAQEGCDRVAQGGEYPRGISCTHHGAVLPIRLRETRHNTRRSVERPGVGRQGGCRQAYTSAAWTLTHWLIPTSVCSPA